MPRPQPSRVAEQAEQQILRPRILHGPDEPKRDQRKFRGRAHARRDLARHLFEPLRGLQERLRAKSLGGRRRRRAWRRRRGGLRHLGLGDRLKCFDQRIASGGVLQDFEGFLRFRGRHGRRGGFACRVRRGRCQALRQSRRRRGQGGQNRDEKCDRRRETETPSQAGVVFLALIRQSFAPQLKNSQPAIRPLRAPLVALWRLRGE